MPSPSSNTNTKATTSNYIRNITYLCGGDDETNSKKQHDIWHDLQYLHVPRGNQLTPKAFALQEGRCFDPVLTPGALQALYQAHPNATILNMIRDPQEWYSTLSYGLHQRWKGCINMPRHIFPSQNTEEQYAHFYRAYHQRIRDFVTHHPSWSLIEIDLTLPAQTITQQLQDQWNVAPPKCWTEATESTIHVQESPTTYKNIPIRKDGKDDHSISSDNDVHKYDIPPVVTGSLPRPNDITYPILAMSLSKSGTTNTNAYFTCNLGLGKSAHYMYETPLAPPHQQNAIALCLRDNIENGRNHWNSVVIPSRSMPTLVFCTVIPTTTIMAFAIILKCFMGVSPMPLPRPILVPLYFWPSAMPQLGPCRPSIFMGREKNGRPIPIVPNHRVAYNFRHPNPAMPFGPNFITIIR